MQYVRNIPEQTITYSVFIILTMLLCYRYSVTSYPHSLIFPRLASNTFPSAMFFLSPHAVFYFICIFFTLSSLLIAPLVSESPFVHSFPLSKSRVSSFPLCCSLSLPSRVFSHIPSTGRHSLDLAIDLSPPTRPPYSATSFPHACFYHAVPEPTRTPTLCSRLPPTQPPTHPAHMSGNRGSSHLPEGCMAVSGVSSGRRRRGSFSRSPGK